MNCPSCNKETDTLHSLHDMNACIDCIKQLESSIGNNHITNHDVIPANTTDIFNSRMQSIALMRIEIMSGPGSIADKNEQFICALTARFAVLRNLIANCSRSIDEAKAEQVAINESVNSLEFEIRNSIREKLRQSDLQYVPAPIKDISKAVTKPKKMSAMDKLAAEYAVKHNCSIKIAMEKIMNVLNED